MKHGSKILAVAVLAAAMVASIGFIAADDEERVSLSQVPAAVRATIQKYAAGAKITEIEKATKNGKTLYEVEIKRGASSGTSWWRRTAPSSGGSRRARRKRRRRSASTRRRLLSRPPSSRS